MGFAPNPFGPYCTLACCKPRIRKYANVGEYVIGTGSAKRNMQGRLIFWMKISEITDFDHYWIDPRFQHKKPYMRGSRRQRFGDNVYHRKPGSRVFTQEDSFHSLPGGKVSRNDRNRDTGLTHRVLIAEEFTYWGSKAPKIPGSLKDFVLPGVGWKVHFEEKRVRAFLNWMLRSPARGLQGEPVEWDYLPEKRA